MATEPNVRDESAGTAVEEKKKPAPKPKAPAKKPAAKGKKKEDRRFFLFTAVGAAWTAFTVVGGLYSLAVLRFLFPNVLAEPPSKFKTGMGAGQFEPGVVETRWKNEFQVWIVSLVDEGKLVALSTICTHLGCSPNWLEAEKKFKCPCHGSGFYKNGVNFEGPAPRPLERFAIYEENGVVVVDKSRKFQNELGQWDDSLSYLPI